MLLMPRRDFNLFDDFFRDDLKNNFNLMRTDIKETDKEILLDIDLPGYKKENIKISVDNNYLIVDVRNYEKKEENNNNYVRRERFLGECSRRFYIGEDIKVEDIKANYRNGILSLKVLKTNPKEKNISRKYVEISD